MAILVNLDPIFSSDKDSSDRIYCCAVQSTLYWVNDKHLRAIVPEGVYPRHCEAGNVVAEFQFRVQPDMLAASVTISLADADLLIQYCLGTGLFLLVDTFLCPNQKLSLENSK